MINYFCLGNNIQNIREKVLKMNRDEFATLIGVSSNSLGRIERGERKNIDINIINNICNCTGFTFKQLTSNKKLNNYSYSQRIHFLLSKFSSSQLDYIYRWIFNFYQFTKKSHM